MAITLENIDLPPHGLLDINIQKRVNIHITSHTARQQVSVFVGNHIADLLHSDVPELVLRKQGVYWRVPVVLSSRSLGRIGIVGSIDVDVQTGELTLTDSIISEIKNNAQRFAVGTAL